MTTVWVLTGYESNEGESVQGVFATAEAAKAEHSELMWVLKPGGVWLAPVGDGYAGCEVTPHELAGAPDPLTTLRAEKKRGEAGQ